VPACCAVSDEFALTVAVPVAATGWEACREAQGKEQQPQPVGVAVPQPQPQRIPARAAKEEPRASLKQREQ